VDERSLRIQRRFEVPMVIAALLVIPLIAIEQSDLGEPWPTIAEVLNWGTWLAFLAEFVVMMAVVPDRWLWLRRNPIDAIVVFLTPPFLPASLEAARLFRLLRLLRLLRIVPAMRRLLTVQGIKYAALLAVTTVIVGGAVFAEVEKTHDGKTLSSWDGIWWAATTVTTVGYGDIYPGTTGGRVIAMTIMAVGIGFVALLTAFVADRFIQQEVGDDIEDRDERILAELREIRDRLDRLERS
jgi:voltage-gated potassium channel